MNKKLNYLALFPLFGSAIFLFLLFIKATKKEIRRDIFHLYLFSSAIVGVLSILISILFLNFISSLAHMTNLINSYGILIAFIIGGVLLNLFVFILINKNWDKFNNTV